MNEDLRLSWQGTDGTNVVVKACQCLTCENFFFVPASEFEENPHYCPFCGIKFNPDNTIFEEDDALSKELGKMFPDEDNQ